MNFTKRLNCKKWFFLGFALISCVLCNAQDVTNRYFELNPKPTRYGQDVTCTLRTQSVNLVQVKVDDGEWKNVPVVFSSFLQAKEETQKDYSVSVRVFQTDETSPLIYEKTFLYTIDKKAPRIPQFWYKKTETGYSVFFTTEKPQSTIRYSVYDVAFSRRKDGIVKNVNEPINLGTSDILFACEVDIAGNVGNPLLFDFSTKMSYSNDFSIVSPAHGIWNNPQTLVLVSTGASDLVYTIDGSDPRENGISYDKPFVFLQSGNYCVRVYDKKTHTEKTVNFSQNLEADTDEKNTLGSFDSQFIDGILAIPQNSSIKIPKDAKFGFGTQAELVAPSGELFIPVVPNAPRFLPILIKTGSSNFRYMLHLGAFETEKEASQVDRNVAEIPSTGEDSKTETQILLQKKVESTTDSSLTVRSTDNAHILQFPLDARYSIDGATWTKVEKASFCNSLGLPVVLSRNQPHEIRWQSPTCTKNEVTHFFLSGKLFSQELVTIEKAEDYFIIIKKLPSQVELHYEMSFSNLPKKVTLDSPVIEDSLKIDIPEGDQITLLVSVSAFAGNETKTLIGESVHSIFIDKMPPEKPTYKFLGSEHNSLWSKQPVQIEWGIPKPEELLFTGIAIRKIDNFAELSESTSPDFWPIVTNFDAETRIFTVDTEQVGAVAYTVSAFTQDSFGNKSMVESLHGVLNKNAWFVSNQKADLKNTFAISEEDIFSSIEEALIAIKENRKNSPVKNTKDNPLPTVLYVYGDVLLNESILLDEPLVVMKCPETFLLQSSSTSSIKVMPWVTLAVKNANVSFRDISIERVFSDSSKMNDNFKKDVPLVFAKNANLAFYNVSLNSEQSEKSLSKNIAQSELVNASDSVVVFDNAKLSNVGDWAKPCGVFFNSQVDFIGSDVFVSNKQFAQGIEIVGGRASFKNGTITTLSAEGAVLGVVLRDTDFILDASILELRSASAGRSLEAWNSDVMVSDSIFSLYDENKKLKSVLQENAIWLDETSFVKLNLKNKFFGFKKLN